MDRQQQVQRRQDRPDARRVRRWFLFSCVPVLVTVLLFTYVNGGLAQTIHALFGASGSSHTVLELSTRQYLTEEVEPGVKWSVSTTLSPLAPMPLMRITPILRPALAGEGVWIAQSTAPSPYTSLPLVAKTFLRPDPLRPSAIVTFAQFDTRFFRLHMVAGTTQPGGPRGVYGPGVIPASDQKGNTLLAAFNGGFMYADGQYGMKVNGIVYAPPQARTATVAVTKEGQIIIGAWGVDPRLNSGNADLVAWRQNVFPLIDHGAINPLTQNGALWGLTVLNQPWAYTWRSGIGITAHGGYIYAEGNLLSAQTLAEALHAAGAVMAMQTDINHFWMRGFLYQRERNGTLQILRLDPTMYGTGSEYLTGTFRDFFYLTRFAPPLPVHSSETIAQ